MLLAVMEAEYATGDEDDKLLLKNIQTNGVMVGVFKKEN